MSEAARSRRDDARREPQVGIPGRDGIADPLAELARLVGQEDPFRRVFRPAPAPERQDYGAHGGWTPDRAVEVGHDAEEAHRAAAPDEHDGYGHHEAAHGYADHGYDTAAHDEDGAHHGHDDYDGHADHHGQAEYDAHGGHHDHAGYDGHGYAAARGDEAGLADEHFADEAAAAALPDVWARGGDDPQAYEPPAPESASRAASSARRPLAVLAAVLVLTGGGLAASFVAKGPGSASVASGASGRTAPTIMAAAGPTKVKVEDTSATAPEDQDAALLNKSAAPSSGPVKIVSSQEQPADLSQLPKASDLAAGARPLPPPAPSPFPEPKKVKTFVVHPDGSMLSGDPPPAADAAQPSTPKAEARGGATTPRSDPAPAAAPTIASLAAGTADPAPAARQPASPGVRATPAKPNDAADAPGAAGGSYGLQLASSPAEAEAQAAFGRLKKKYPALLGSLTATIHRAETGDKPVYRVRVGGMSQDEARALCTRLQGAGGSCFVVHN